MEGKSGFTTDCIQMLELYKQNRPERAMFPIVSFPEALEAKVAQEGFVLTEAQVAALEKAKEEKQAHGEIETYHPGYLGAQDTYYVGYIKGVSKIYQQTFIDTYAKVAAAKLYDRKIALVVADMLNERVIPIYDQYGIPLLRTLTDRGTEYCRASVAII